MFSAPPPAPAVVHIVTVKSGDTLGSISENSCGTTQDWESIWHQNQAEIPDPDYIHPGQVLRFTCEEIARLAATADAVIRHPLSGTLGCPGLEQLWKDAGGNPAEAFIAAEIAMAESGGNQYALSPTDDYGYWQVNSSHGPAMATFNPLGNARAAVAISADGTDWDPWTTFVDGAYAGRC